MTEHHWTLHRLGWEEPNFVLQPHLSLITVGRAVEVTKQLLGSHISRKHSLFRRTVDSSDGRTYWEIMDSGSSTKTFVNNVPISPHQPIRLNDRDLIGFGSNGRRNVRTSNMKRMFLYEIHAPTHWTNDNPADDDSDDEREKVDSNSVTPPPPPYFPDVYLPDVVSESIQSESENNQETNEDREGPSSSSDTKSTEKEVISSAKYHGSNTNKGSNEGQDQGKGQESKEGEESSSKDSQVSEEIEQVAEKQANEQCSLSLLDMLNSDSDEEKEKKDLKEEKEKVKVKIGSVSKEQKIKDSIVSKMENLPSKHSMKTDSKTEVGSKKNLTKKGPKEENGDKKKAKGKSSKSESFCPTATSSKEDKKETSKFNDAQKPGTVKNEKVIKNLKVNLTKLKVPTDSKCAKVIRDGKQLEWDQDDGNNPDRKRKCLDSSKSSKKTEIKRSRIKRIESDSESENENNKSGNENDSDPEFVASFSQSDEVIVIDSDESDTEYFKSSQEKNKENSNNKKDDEKELESLAREASSDDEDEEDEVVVKFEKDPDLEDSQLSLYNRVLAVSIGEEPGFASLDDQRDEIVTAPAAEIEEEEEAAHSDEDDISNLLSEADKEEENNKVFDEDLDSEPKTEGENSGKVLRRSLSAEFDYSTKKATKLIDAIPQPSRRAFNRGIDQETATKSSAEITAGQNNAIPTKSFYQLSAPKSGSFSRSTASAKSKLFQCKEAIVAERKKRLQALAEKGKGVKDTKEKSNTSAVKVKSSDPKSSNFLSPAPVPKKRTVLEKTEPESTKTSVDEKSTENEPDPKKPRTKAELRQDHDGQMVVKKLSFNNVLSNVFSQDLMAASEKKIPPAKKKSEPKTTSKTCLKRKKDVSCLDTKKRVGWKTDSCGKVAVQIKFIPPEGLGHKVNQRGAKTFELKVVAKQTNTGVTPIAEVPHIKNSQIPKDIPRYLDSLIRILNWNTAWLEEQAKIKEAPPVEGVGFKVCHNPGTFDNFRDYANTFYPLLLHEMWASVYKDYESSGKNRCYEVMMVVTSVRNDEKFAYIHLLGLVSEDQKRDDFYLPCDGYLSRVDLRCRLRADNREQIRPLFGYVTHSRIRRRMNNQDEIYLKPLLEASMKHRAKRDLKHVLDVFMVAKPLQADIVLTPKPMIVKGVSRIKPSLRPIQAVEDFCFSPLFQSLLFPKNNLSTFSQAKGDDDIRPDVQNMPAIKNLNACQLKIVKSTARQATGSPNLSHVSLIQGPPGTGKTSTIVATILQIFSRWRHLYPKEPLPRILLTAPSNAAVDEIIVRLLNIRKMLKPDQTFNMIRIGRERAINPEVRGISLDCLRENEITKRMDILTNSSSVDMEIRHRQETINQLGDQLRDANEMRATVLTRKIKEERDLLERAKNTKTEKENRGFSKEKDRVRRDTSEKLLEYADIIGTTLSSSLNGQMSQYFLNNALQPSMSNQKHRRFSICIVDEATQSIEPETLIPLKLGFNKLILVGDPEQLPATVNSQKAKELSLNDSLFHRLFNQLKLEENCTQTLNIQYRMHPEICSWPNKYFYGGILENGPQNRDTILSPLILFDLKTSREQIKGSSKWNEIEAKFVCKIVREIYAEHLRKIGRQLTIGVITFYAKQVDAIRKELASSGINRPPVSVRTVDGYQGSESDIIIISCVRTSKTSIGFLSEIERLNVALTRARYALYMVGNFNSLKNNEMWQNLIEESKTRHVIREVNNNSNPNLTL